MHTYDNIHIKSDKNKIQKHLCKEKQLKCKQIEPGFIQCLDFCYGNVFISE